MKKHVLKTLVAVVAASAMLFAACGKEGNEGGDSRRYTLTVEPNNPAWGTTTGSGTYNSGDRVDVEAVPATGYYFIKWSDGAVSNPRTVTVSSDMTLYGLFSATQDDPNPYNPADTTNSDPNTDTIPTPDPNPTPTPDPNPAPTPDPSPTAGEWVDLGLPSGLLWASCNLGATSPEEYGDYYAWGETTTKSTYNWSTYQYGNYYNQLTKYCNIQSYGNNGFIDNLTTLLPEDDAATQVLGSGARIPTKEEWQELIDYTIMEWTTMNGVNGCRFTAANGNALFLPAAGYRDGSSLDGAGSFGVYWSASLDEDGPDFAWGFYFDSGSQYMGNGSRYGGHSVRAVRASEN